MTASVCSTTVRSVLCIGVLACGVSHARAQTLPAPWSNRDIGATGVAGNATESGGSYTVRGAGSDIWNYTDQFHFVYRQVTGDVDLRAHVAGLEYVRPWTKGGVMIRETLTDSSRHASTFVTPARGLAFQRRIYPDGESVSTPGGSGVAPYWVRIVRSGQLFTSYVSADGATWTLVGSETLAMQATVYVGLAVVSNVSGQTAMATFTNVSVNGSGDTTPAPSEPPPPPPPGAVWSRVDVGAPALPGRATESGGTFSVTGAGVDIWSTADEFHYMYQPASGDVEIVARVATIEEAHVWSKAGVMIRETLTGPSAHAFMTGSAARGWAFQRRPSTGNVSLSSPGTAGYAPGWVRLVRSGDTFRGYESADGSTWTLVGTETVPMASDVYVGLAVTSHNTAATSNATFTNVTITRPTPGNTSPTVTLTAPANGSTFTAPATISLSATAGDTDGSVARVDFVANGQVVASDATAPYQASWSSVPQGTYNVTAVAIDNAGAATTSGTAAITVNGSGSGGPNTPPTVEMTSPANRSTYSAPASIPVAASATDNGTVARVDFYAGATYIGSDSSAPFGITWNNVAAGTYAISSAAYDDTGLATWSSSVHVTVEAAPSNTPPTVSITSPGSGATFTAPASIAISANAADSNGTVSRVDFYAGTQLVGSDTTAGYGVTWSNVPAGTYSLTAVAHDNAGAATTSAAVTVTVNPAPNTPPTVSITSPASGATFTAPASIGITANAADSNGTVSRVDFYAGTQLVGSDTTSGYGVTWSNVPAGTYSLTAVAHDNAGAATTSAAVTVTVNPAPNTPPTVSITSPGSGATFTAPASIAITASAADSNGTVSRVDFYAGAQLLGSDTTAGYGVTWTNVPAGTYSLTAVAHDNAGATATSAPVTVTVNPAPPPPPSPTSVIFNASPDHDTDVTSYSVAVFRSGDDPATAAPAATRNIGKPAPSSSTEITVDISDLVNPLPAGTYFAVVTAIGPGGSAASTPSANFTK